MRTRPGPASPAIDALLQLEVADRLEDSGRHDEAVTSAANAVTECLGYDALLASEVCLVAGNPEPDFNVKELLLEEVRADEESYNREESGPRLVALATGRGRCRWTGGRRLRFMRC